MLRERKPIYKIGIILVCISFVGWMCLAIFQILSLGLQSTSLQGLIFLVGGALPIIGGLGMALLAIGVIMDRISSREDDYYSKNVER